MKKPHDMPAVGDCVRLRGRKSTGVLVSVNERDWARVDWNSVMAEPGPKLCHLFELEKVA